MATKKSTILVMSQVYVPDPTSVGQHMHDAAKELASRGYHVRVLTSARGYEDPSKHYPKYEVLDGVSIRRLPLSSFGKSSILIRLIGGISFTLQCIVHGLFLRNLTHIVVSTSPPMCPLAAVVLNMLRGTPITYWVMDLNPDQMIELGKTSPTSLQVRIFDWLNRQILRRSQTVVALDRFMAERLNRKVDIMDKLVVFPPWPLEDHVEPVEHADNPFRQEQGLTGKTVIMYSGNLSIASPVDTILEVAKRVTDLPDLLFLFIGGGLVKKQIDELIAREKPTNIRTLPYQPIETLRYSLSAADVHLVAVGEKIVGICHPCKIYGSMAVARPVLSLGPAECHASDILAEGEIGWAIEHGDFDKAERVIREIHATAEADRMAMGREARRMVDRQFSKQLLCGRFADVVEHGPQVDASYRKEGIKSAESAELSHQGS
ncbi:MAG: glycosyltransferase family 4 protein [Bythopirellula sp.]|nr:glycosyltransferase family 4 protein [Bythopirellula sp.]